MCSYEVLNDVLRAIEGDTSQNEIHSFIFSPGQGDAIDNNLLNTIADKCAALNTIEISGFEKVSETFRMSWIDFFFRIIQTHHPRL